MTTYHTLNRGFLLLALGLSFFIPLVQLPTFSKQVPELMPESTVLDWFAEPSMEHLILEPIAQAPSNSIAVSLMALLYAAITCFMLLRSFVYLFGIRKLKKHSEAVPRRWFTLFKTSQTRPFSFFKSVFIPRSLFGSDAFEQVLTHECVHVRRFHSWDRVFLDFVVSLFWFNPFIYCYRNALIEIHEYEADEGVIKQYNDPVKYQEVLFSQLQSAEYSGLVSHFNFQMIKKRIVMMNKQKKRTGWIYGVIVPVTLIMIFAFSNKEAMEPLNQVGKEITSFIGPLGPVDNQTSLTLQDDTEPSLLPLKEKDMVRMSSGFGMRMHPIKKEKMMHKGMDFVCDIGTEIIAAAGGEVLELRENKEGYGKLLIIDHGNGFITRYGQLSEFKVKEGDRVEKGEVIALSGNSGMSTGPHLHYEVIKDGKNVDPAEYIKNFTFSKKVSAKPTLEKKEDSQTLGHLHDLKEREELLAVRTQELELREQELAMVEEQLVKEEIERVYVESLKAANKQMKETEAQLQVRDRVKTIEKLDQKSKEANSKEKEKKKSKSKEKVKKN